MPVSKMPALPKSRSLRPAPTAWARLMRAPLPAALAIAGALAACSSDGPVKGVAEVAGLATTPQESKPFVRETRPADPAYIPVGRVFPEDPLCFGETPPPPYNPTGTAARFARPVERKATDACKPRADFKNIEAELEAKRLANDAASTQAKALGQALPPPKPAVIPPTN
ncbi:MAG: hypothetical protein K2Z25_04175 [Beijerinckiaceae bacterium]|nr:hypothetical protein [Beijerinckiaceae bacterium]